MMTMLARCHHTVCMMAPEKETRSAVGTSGNDVKIKSMWTRKLLSTKNDLSVEVHWLIDDYGAIGASVVP